MVQGEHRGKLRNPSYQVHIFFPDDDLLLFLIVFFLSRTSNRFEAYRSGTRALGFLEEAQKLINKCLSFLLIHDF